MTAEDEYRTLRITPLAGLGGVGVGSPLPPPPAPLGPSERYHHHGHHGHQQTQQQQQQHWQHHSHTLPHLHHYEREQRDRYAAPPSPASSAHSDRERDRDRERYLPPPAPAPLAPMDRYLLSPSPVPPPGSQPIERYVPPPAPSGSAPNADRYAGGDVYNRFHHHYRSATGGAGGGGGGGGSAGTTTQTSSGYQQQQYHQYHTLRAHGAHGHQQHRYNHHHVVTPSHSSRGLHHIRCCQTPSPGPPGPAPSGAATMVPANAAQPYSLPSPSGRPSSHGLSARLLPTSSSSSSSSSSTASANCGRHSSTPPPLASLPLGRCSSEELGAGLAEGLQGLQQGMGTVRPRRCAPQRYGVAALGTLTTLPPQQAAQTQTTGTLPAGLSAAAAPAPAVRGGERRESRDSRDSRESIRELTARERDARDGDLHTVAWRGVTGSSQQQQQQQQPAPSPTPSINVSSADSQHSAAAVLRSQGGPDSGGGSGSGGSSTASTTTASLEPPASPLKHPHHLSPQMSAPAGVATARTQAGCTVAFSQDARRMSASAQVLGGQAQVNVPGNAGPSRHRLQRQQSKSEMVRNYIKRETAAFFGVDPMHEEAQRARWVDRRKRLATRRYGDLKDEYAIAPSLPTTPVTPVTPYAMQSRLARPDVLPLSGPQDVTDSTRWEEPPVRRKESVARMTFSGVAFVVSRLARQRAREPTLSRTLSRSIQPAAQAEARALGPAARYRAQSPTLGAHTVQEPFFDVLTRDSREVSDGSATAPSGELSHLLDPSAAASATTAAAAAAAAAQDHRHGDGVDAGQSLGPYHFQHRDRQPKWARQTTDSSGESSSREVGMSRIGNTFLDRAFDNSDRRQYGMGLVGKLFGRSIKRSVVRQPKVREQLEDIEDHRPYFTYWVTTVQILILFISIACYGFGTIGFNLNQRSGLVLTTSLSLKQVDYSEPANFWIGPRAADLIHLGAKFAPCMRKDIKILKEIDESRLKERNTACCIRNDESGCVQSSRSDCSYTIETWKKWSNGNMGPGGRISGSVCGLDPKYCEAPASIAPYEWPDDITKWPICRKTNSRGSPQRRFQYKDKAAEHMVCEVIGHPCCIGIHGSCEITTKEYCDFVRGYFHEEASLCSQVSCLDDVCGMIPFWSPEIPDQFYRLWTSLFLHAGLFHLVITIVIQYFLMRDLEKLTGAFRIGVIYMGSGVAGNLASAIFVPYRAEVGPAGSQFGLLACLIVEVLNVWPMLKRPGHAMLRLLGITLFLFVLGLMPWIDNYAHLFGFIFGFLLSYALLPYVSFGTYDRQRKIALIWVCLLSCLFLFAALFALFYVIPVYDCEICTYFNCLPLTRDFCAEQNINLKRDDGLV